MAELANGERYWFTGEEEQELMKHNEPYYIQPPSHDVFFQCFRLPEKGEEHQLYTSSYIYSILLNPNRSLGFLCVVRQREIL